MARKNLIIQLSTSFPASVRDLIACATIVHCLPASSMHMSALNILANYRLLRGMPGVQSLWSMHRVSPLPG